MFRPPVRRRVARSGSERGTSLLEVVVTAALLSGGVLATVSVLDGVRNGTAAVDRRAQAHRLARDSMETLRATAYDELGISPSMLGYVPTFEGRDTVRISASTVKPTETVTIGNEDYVIRRAVTWDAVTLSNGSAVAASWKRLVVIVEFDGGSRSVRLDGGMSPLQTGSNCSSRSVDTAPSPLTGVVNSYVAGTGSSIAGATVLSVIEPYRTGGGAPIAPGDLLLVVQMTSSPGGTAGLYEYAIATSAVSSGRLSVSGRGLGGGLLNAYGTDGRFQVVRVPTYGAVTVGAGMAALPWDGWTGGVLAFDAAGDVTLTAPISIDATGATSDVATGVTPSATRLVMGSADAGPGGGVAAIRASAITGVSSITADGIGSSEGGTILVTTERDDLSGVTLSATASGSRRGGTILTNTPGASVDVHGNPDGAVDSAVDRDAVVGIPLGVGCLPAVTTSVVTSTTTVPRAAGVSLGYRIRVTNAAGRGTAENVAVQDFLPTGFGLESTSLVILGGGAARSPAVDGSIGSSSPQWSTFTLPGGASVDIYFRATLPTSTPLSRADNEAAATYTSSGLSFAAAFAGNSSTLDDVVIVG